VWRGIPPFCVARARKGDKVKCQFCEQDAPGLIKVCLYTPEGIWVCEECYWTIDRHRRKPYSKIMDKVAIAEAGWYVNRKLARNQI
jgi:ribosomal protein L37AE/L43A